MRMRQVIHENATCQFMRISQLIYENITVNLCKYNRSFLANAKVCINVRDGNLLIVFRVKNTNFSSESLVFLGANFGSESLTSLFLKVRIAHGHFSK